MGREAGAVTGRPASERAAAMLSHRGLGAVLEAVCREYHVTHAEVLGRSRRQSIARARHCLCWRLAHEHGLSTVEIMPMVDRDKSTVWDAIEVHWQRIQRGEARAPEGVTLAGLG